VVYPVVIVADVVLNAFIQFKTIIGWDSGVGQKLGLPSGENILVDFKFLGQFREGILAFDGF
jgi:hypothetical protein